MFIENERAEESRNYCVYQEGDTMQLKRGINLGGYLSQCVHSRDHYESFIEYPRLHMVEGVLPGNVW